MNKQERMARAISDLLVGAEDAAKRGDEAQVDELLAKASALQLKFAIDDAMLARQDNTKSEEIIFMDFCHESNTPLIKAKRELVASLAKLYRGRAILMPEWQPRKGGNEGRGLKLNKRAYVRVFAHESDVRFISMLYTSLILQMQTMMAADEKDFMGPAKEVSAWRVSYAYAWVRRVYSRLLDTQMAQESASETGTPGTALVLRDRAQLVTDYVDSQMKVRSNRFREDNRSEAGRQAGRAAANRADLGGTKVSDANRAQLRA